MGRAWLFFAVPAGAGLCWQALGALRDDQLSVFRVVALAVGMAVVLWSVRLRQRRDATVLARIGFALATAALFWMSVVEMALDYTWFLALGTLLLAAAGLIHATALVAHPEFANPGGIFIRAKYTKQLAVCIAIIVHANGNPHVVTVVAHADRTG